MKKVLDILIYSIFVFAVFSFAAPRVSAREERSVAVTKLEPPKGEKKDFYLVTGENVEVTGEVNGDVYVFGGQVTISGNISGDVLAIGGTVIVNGNVSQNVFAAGGTIFIRGSLGGNAVLAGGQIEVLDPARISGGLLSASGELNLSSPIEGQVRAAASKITFGSLVGSDVEVVSENIRLTNTAQIGGDLVYTSDNDAAVSGEASLSGKLLRKTSPQFSMNTRENYNKFMKGFSVTGKVLAFLSTLLIGFIFIKIFPEFIKKLSENLDSNLIKSFGWGFAALILIPVLSFLILITIVGIPLSLIMFFFYILTLYLSKIFVAYFLGTKVVKGKNIYAKFTSGIILLYLIFLIPVLGGIASFITLCLGLGTSVITLRPSKLKIRE